MSILSFDMEASCTYAREIPVPPHYMKPDGKKVLEVDHGSNGKGEESGKVRKRPIRNAIGWADSAR